MTLKELCRFQYLHHNMFNRKVFSMEEYEVLRCKYFSLDNMGNYSLRLGNSIHKTIEYYIENKIEEVLND